MGLVLELETPEATYILDMSRDGHFAIDCKCGRKDGNFSGTHLKNASGGLEREIAQYEPARPETKLEHSFYMSQAILLDRLREEHDDAKGQQPLVIVCNDCSREFSLTRNGYAELHNACLREYNRKIMAAHRPETTL